jgi:hypothetical protein
MEPTQCFETSAFNTQTPGKYPEDNLLLLNMFRALLCPSSGARQNVVAASGFRMDVEVNVFSAVVGLLVASSWVFYLSD